MCIYYVDTLLLGLHLYQLCYTVHWRAWCIYTFSSLFLYITFSDIFLPCSSYVYRWCPLYRKPCRTDRVVDVVMTASLLPPPLHSFLLSLLACFPFLLNASLFLHINFYPSFLPIVVSFGTVETLFFSPFRIVDLPLLKKLNLLLLLRWWQLDMPLLPIREKR